MLTPVRGARNLRKSAEEIDADIGDDATAARDHEPVKVTDSPAPPIKYRAPDLAALIKKTSVLPWVELRLGTSAHAESYARIRAGQSAVVIGPSGSGKTTIVVGTIVHHARHTGPVVLVELEMDADLVGARVVSMELDVSWEDAARLRGAATAEATGDVLQTLGRLVVLAGDDATIAQAEQAVAMLREECPGEPILVAWDYLQIMPGTGEDRARVAGNAEAIRRFTQRHSVASLVVSQTSRASARGLKDGELVGADTTGTGAESSQIERMAAVTVALGNMKPREDGGTDVDISIGKGRFGGGDTVRPAIHYGRSGRWEFAGPAVSGAEKRAERSAARDESRVIAARHAIPGHLAASTVAQSRSEVRAALHLRRDDVSAAVRDLLADPASDVVEVRGKRIGGAWPLWTRARAAAAGVDVVPVSIGGRDE